MTTAHATPAGPPLPADAITVTGPQALDLMTGPGDPWLIWDGTQARVIAEADAEAMPEPWLLIASRDDVLAADPGAHGYSPAELARLLTETGRALADLHDD